MHFLPCVKMHSGELAEDATPAAVSDATQPRILAAAHVRAAVSPQRKALRTNAEALDRLA
jgi:hypothetical protein